VHLLIEAARLSQGRSALDVACGPGHITQMIANTGATATGVDLSTEMVKVAEELHPHIEFKEANVEQHLPFESESFDAVLVNFAIHHFARPDLAVKEIRRVLKENGRFVFAGPMEQFGFGAFIGALASHHTMDELPHGPIYLDATQEDYEDLIRKAGFSQYTVDVRQLSLHLENLDLLLQTGWELCQLSDLPQGKQDKIRATTVENASPYETEDGYEFPDRIVFGVATK